MINCKDLMIGNLFETDKNELQNSDFILPGNLGSVKIASTGKVFNVTKAENNNKAVTLTISPVVDHYLNGVPITEDADFEVIEPEKSFDENVKDFMNVGDNLQQAVYHAHSIEMYNICKGLIEPNQLPDKSEINVPE